MNPEMQKQLDEHIKRVVDQVHEAYKPITANLVKQLADSQLDVMSLSQQNSMLQKQSEAIHKQLEESLQKVSDLENQSDNGNNDQDPIKED